MVVSRGVHRNLHVTRSLLFLFIRSSQDPCELVSGMTRGWKRWACTRLVMEAKRLQEESNRGKETMVPYKHLREKIREESRRRNL